MSDIYKAIIDCDLNGLKEAISNGGDVNKTIMMNQKPLHFAVVAKHNQNEMIKALLDNGAKIDAPGANESTALHMAVSWGKVELVKFLLEKGANVKAVDRNKKTPLHLVDSRNKDPKKITAIAITLTNYGADIQARDDQGQTPMDNKNEVVKHALKNYSDHITARETLQELSATNDSNLEKNVIDRLLEEHYGIKTTETDNKENQKDIGSGDDKKPAAKKENSISDNTNIKAFSQPQNTTNSIPNLINDKRTARNLSNDKKEGLKTNKRQGGPKH